MPTTLYARLMTALLLVLSIAGLSAHAEPIDFGKVDPADHTYEDWYIDTADGKPIGYWRSSLTIDGDKIVSLYEEHSVESHGGELSTYNYSIVWTETKDFKPISIVMTTAAGSDTVTKTYRFVDNGIELTSEQNGRTIKRTLPPIKGEFLTSAQESIAIDLYLKQGVDKFTYSTLDLSVGLKPYETTYTRSGDNKQAFKLADGTETDIREWVTTFAVIPGFEMKNFVDDKGKIVGVAYDVDEMKFASRLADKTVKNQKFDPPEMSGLSVVAPDRPIKNIDQQKKIVFELSYDAGENDIVPASTSLQTVERLGPGSARVTVNLDAKPVVNKDDRPTDKHLASSIMIDHEDKLVRELAMKAASKLGENPLKKHLAISCKRYVTRHITGTSLAVGDGTASEAVRTREGDCTECSVLLAALLRVHGIPSRCVSGLVYSADDFVGQKDVFVYHQWTQAWIEDEPGKGHWLDLDSAMWRYSAGHIAMGTSAMGDNDQEDFVKLIPMQQDLKIKVISTTDKPGK